MEIQPVYSKSSNLSQSAELSNWFSFILGAYVAKDKQCQNSSLPRQHDRPEKTSRGLEVRGESHVSQDISPHGTSDRGSQSSRPCIYVAYVAHVAVEPKRRLFHFVRGS